MVGLAVLRMGSMRHFEEHHDQFRVFYDMIGILYFLGIVPLRPNGRHLYDWTFEVFCAMVPE